MSIRISELTPKGATLSETDLFEISEETPDGYESKSITGAEIITAAQSGLQPTLVSGTNIKTINGNTLLGSGDLVVGGGLTIGTTAITSGSVGGILFQGTGNVVQQDSNFIWDNTNKRLGLGATPATNVRLDVRAQGALSTDIAFRVWNSANTANIAVLNGNFSGSYAKLGIGLSSGVPILHNIDALYTSGTAPNISLGTSALAIREGANSFVRFIGGGVRSIAVSNGAANTGLGNAFEMYSADIVAGNAAPHFRTENGNVIKIYRETTAVAAAAFVANTSLIANDSATYGGYTMGQVVAALKEQGLLA